MKAPLSRGARRTALIAHGLLIAAQLAIGGTLPWLGAALLLLPLPGLWRGREYSYQWSSMLVAFYCALWLAEGWANPGGRALAFGVAALAAVDFVSQVLYVRLRARERSAPVPASAGAWR
ncbi:DUF2069 domain-containing protein [Sinimarinibacterium thermocellulolyticum]|uniref:DUF2069 domain-containing protein n=1 Tax=Sinimarinibacterium thermocellulolyticum TaxID=3170016 RepID=A0ABV2AB55_9GAMM